MSSEKAHSSPLSDRATCEVLELPPPAPSSLVGSVPSPSSSSDASVTLWQFLLELLLSREHSHLICWASNEGEFRLLDPEQVAALWGQRKNKQNMNYDKLSRALRYYYDKNIIKKVMGQKFVYKFVSFPDGFASTAGRPDAAGPHAPATAARPPAAGQQQQPFKAKMETLMVRSPGQPEVGNFAAIRSYDIKSGLVAHQWRQEQQQQQSLLLHAATLAAAAAAAQPAESDKKSAVPVIRKTLLLREAGTGSSNVTVKAEPIVGDSASVIVHHSLADASGRAAAPAVRVTPGCYSPLPCDDDDMSPTEPASVDDDPCCSADDGDAVKAEAAASAIKSKLTSAAAAQTTTTLKIPTMLLNDADFPGDSSKGSTESSSSQTGGAGSGSSSSKPKPDPLSIAAASDEPVSPAPGGGLGPGGSGSSGGSGGSGGGARGSRRASLPSLNTPLFPPGSAAVGQRTPLITGLPFWSPGSPSAPSGAGTAGPTFQFPSFAMSPAALATFGGFENPTSPVFVSASATTAGPGGGGGSGGGGETSKLGAA